MEGAHDIYSLPSTLIKQTAYLTDKKLPYQSFIEEDWYGETPGRAYDYVKGVNEKR